MAQHTEEIKHIADGLSVMTVIGTLADVLPAIAALFTIVWTGFRIWETETVKGWLKRK
jgi:hypothetical protein